MNLFNFLKSAVIFCSLNELIIISLFLSTNVQLVYSSWQDWWTYEGISGPSYWGRYNFFWRLCSKGKKQSPIDIRPELLLYDPLLPALTLSGTEISGHLINTGKGLVFRVQSEASATFQFSNSPDSKHHNHLHHHLTKHGSAIESAAHQNNILSNANSEHTNSFKQQTNSLDSMDQLVSSIELNGGPLAYAYTLSHISIHYGRDEYKGSEHTISGFQFPGELQFFFFNSQLYPSYEEAQNKAHGLASIAIMIQMAEVSSKAIENSELKRLIHALQNITNKGTIEKIEKLSITNLLPTEHLSTYCTYEGSITQPACFETVQWLVLNKPIYLTSNLFGQLRAALHLDELSRSADNFRPIQKLNNRTIRTNIEFRILKSTTVANETSNSISTNELNSISKPDRMLSCSMRKQMYYRANLRSFGEENL